MAQNNPYLSYTMLRLSPSLHALSGTSCFGSRPFSDWLLLMSRRFPQLVGGNPAGSVGPANTAAGPQQHEDPSTVLWWRFFGGLTFLRPKQTAEDSISSETTKELVLDFQGTNILHVHRDRL